MESYGIHAILPIKSHQTQWNLMGIHEILAIKFHQTQWNPYRVHGVLAIKSHQIQWDNQIPSNPMESYGPHVILEIQCYLMGSMTF